MEVKLSPTSYVVLGLIRATGPCTSYDLKRRAAESVGNFWPFPHTQLYSEPERLASAGLVEIEREEHGRRRRLLSLTPAGEAALDQWLGHADDLGPTEIRDLGLLKLFLSADPTSVAKVARAKLAIHSGKLAGYEATQAHLQPQLEARREDVGMQLRGLTLQMGLRYERLAIDFWTDVLAAAGD